MTIVDDCGELLCIAELGRYIDMFNCDAKLYDFDPSYTNRY